jgi:biotin carboxyl carrier protein
MVKRTLSFGKGSRQRGGAQASEAEDEGAKSNRKPIGSMIIRTFSFDKKVRSKQPSEEAEAGPETFKGVPVRRLSFGKKSSRRKREDVTAAAPETPSTEEVLGKELAQAPAAAPPAASAPAPAMAPAAAPAAASAAAPAAAPAAAEANPFAKPGVEMQEYKIQVTNKMVPDSKIRIPLPGSVPGTFFKIVIYVPPYVEPGQFLSFELPETWVDERIKEREDNECDDADLVIEMERQHMRVLDLRYNARD